MKLTREEISAILVEEAEYAKQFDCGVSEPPRRYSDADKPLDVWLLFMQCYLNEAVHAHTIEHNRDKALECLRKVLSLGTNAALHHGLPRRTPSVPT